MESNRLTLIICRLHRLLLIAALVYLPSNQTLAIGNLSAEDYFIFQKNNKKGLRDSKDKVVIPAEYEDLGWSLGEFNPVDNVLGYYQDGLWGMITLKNKKISPPEYQSLYPLNRQLIAAAKFDEVLQEVRYGIIGPNGKVVLGFEYGSLNIFNNLIIASKKEAGDWKFGMMNLSYQQVLPYKYKRISALNNQYATIMDQEMIGLVDASGKVIVSPGYHVIELNGKNLRGKLFDSYEIKNAQNHLLSSYQLGNLRKAAKGVFIADDKEQSQLIDVHGQVLKSFSRTQVFEFFDDKAVIKKDGFFGVTNTMGDLLVPPNNLSIWNEGQYLGVQLKNGQWNLLDSNLDKINVRDYQEIRPASEGLFAVKRQSSWGYIDNLGSEVIPPQYQEVTNFKEEVALAKYLGSWGLIDKTGNWQIMPRYSSLEKVTRDTYLFRTDTDYGLVKTDNKVTYRTTNELQATKTGAIEQTKDNLFGLTSLDGEQMLSLQYMEIRVLLEDPRHYQFTDETGTGIFNISKRTFARDSAIQEMRTLNEGYIGVRINDQYGFVDLNGKLRIANRYQDVGIFNDDMSAVKLRGRWGYVDRLERLRVQPVYQTVDHFINNLAIVSQNNRFGLIDKSGKVILSLEYDKLERLSDGQYLCYRGKNIGLVDQSGKILLYPGYHSLMALDSGLFKVSKNGKFGLLNQQGRTLIPFAYDELEYDQINDLYLLTKKSPWDHIKL